MSWISDPNAWIGLGTLIGLEIVLGIDNLVFTAILAERLPPPQRDRARFIGLSLALVMRLGLLAGLTWIAQLTAPLVTILGWTFSGRDLILLGGGIFLIAKGTSELHERLDGGGEHRLKRRATPAFWQVIAQIIVLDLVFSLDSIITAVGMVNDVSIMVIAVLVAVGAMILASGPLMRFVARRPTVVILCLGFLLMIGFSLLVEGFGLHIPKGYLYAAIGFSVLVEAANEARRRNSERAMRAFDLRERASDAVLRLLGANTGPSVDALDALAEKAAGEDVFGRQEQLMVHGVLELGERKMRSILTPRQKIEWLDLALPEPALRARVEELVHSQVVVARGALDDFVGVGRLRDLLRASARPGALDIRPAVHDALVLPDSAGALAAMEQLRKAKLRLALVVDEHGAVTGVVTPTDLLEAIAGKFPGETALSDGAIQNTDGSWTIAGGHDIHHLGAMLGIDLADEADRYTTLAGFLVARLGRLPNIGDVIEEEERRFEVLSLDGLNAGSVHISDAPLAD